MTIQLRFRLRFESDWHTSAGHGVGLQADSALTRDQDGIPIINGSTLKGLFRDALFDMAGHSRWPYESDEQIALPHIILGSPYEESRWRFSPARPVNDAQMPRLTPGVDQAHIITGARVDPRTRRTQQGKLYQREMGTRELDFEFTVEGGSEQHDVEWLVAAARYIRRLGSRRRRGAGRCRIDLEDSDLQDALLDAFAQRRQFETGLIDEAPPEIDLPTLPETFDKSRVDTAVQARRFRVFLRADAPVIVAEKHEAGNVYQSQMRIPGQTLRGALAARANPVQLEQSGSPDFDTFLELFVLGDVAFNDLLFLTPPDDNRQGSIVDEIPLGLVKNEHWDIQSALLISSEELQDYRNLGGALVLKPGWHEELKSEQRSYTLSFKTHMHVQIDPNTKRAAEGNLFAYDAIPAGSYFVGEIVLDDAVQWAKLSRLLRVHLGTPFQLAIGRGRNRGYGTCTGWITPLDDTMPSYAAPMPLATRLNNDLSDTHQLVLTLASDTIVLDTWSRAIQMFDASWLSKELGFDVTDIGNCAVRSRVVEGFDTFSGLPHWRDRAFAKGSSVVLQVPFDPRGIIDQLAQLEVRGIGLRRDEGFGRVVFNHPCHLKMDMGSVAPVEIPAALVSTRSQAVGTRAEFIEAWQKHLNNNNHLRKDDFKGKPQYRTLARRLVEKAPVDNEAAKQLIDSLGKPQPNQWPYDLSPDYLRNRREDDRFEARCTDQVKQLLDDLYQKYPEHWTCGAVMLAEAILNLTKPGQEQEA